MRTRAFGAPNVFRSWAWIIFRNVTLADQSTSVVLRLDHSREHKISSLCQRRAEHQLIKKCPKELSACSDLYEAEICGHRTVDGKDRELRWSLRSCKRNDSQVETATQNNTLPMEKNIICQNVDNSQRNGSKKSSYQHFGIF